MEVSPTQASICEGEVVPLRAWGAQSYRWYPQEGLHAQTGPEVLAAPRVSTTYRVEGIDAFGCSQTREVHLTVNPLPRFDLIAEKTDVCEGESVTLRVIGEQAYHLQWDPAYGLSATEGTEVQASPAQPTAYRALATNDLGCMAEAMVELNVQPRPSIQLASERSRICQGDTLYLMADGAQQYEWLPAQALTPVGANNAMAVPLSDMSYTVKGTNEWGCVGEANLAVSVQEPAPLTVEPSHAEICAGEEVALRVSGGNGVYTWESTPGLPLTSGEQVRVSPWQSTTYVVRSYAPDGQGCINEGTATVSVKPKLGIQISATAGRLCEGEEIALMVQGGSDYRWLNNELGASRGLDQTRALAVPRANQSYQVVGVDANGCVDTATIQLEVMQFELDELSTPELIDLAQQGGLVQLEDNTEAATQWAWYLNGELLSEQPAPSFMLDRAGTYYLRLEVGNGVCTKTLQQQISVTNSSRLSELEQLAVDTTAGGATFVLSFESPRSMFLTTQLLDEGGKTVFTDRLRVQAGTFRRLMDLAPLPRGSYQLLVSDGRETQTFDLVKAN